MCAHAIALQLGAEVDRSRDALSLELDFYVVVSKSSRHFLRETKQEEIHAVALPIIVFQLTLKWTTDSIHEVVFGRLFNAVTIVPEVSSGHRPYVGSRQTLA